MGHLRTHAFALPVCTSSFSSPIPLLLPLPQLPIYSSNLSTDLNFFSLILHYNNNTSTHQPPCALRANLKLSPMATARPMDLPMEPMELQTALMLTQASPPSRPSQIPTPHDTILTNPSATS